MNKITIPPRLIAIICFVISIAELFNNLFFETTNYNTIVIKELFNPFNLGWVLSESMYSGTNGLNYIDAFFEGLLLLGAILYTTSKYSQTRFIRVVMSVIFLSNILSILYIPVFFLFILSIKSAPATHL